MVLLSQKVCILYEYFSLRKLRQVKSFLLFLNHTFKICFQEGNALLLVLSSHLYLGSIFLSIMLMWITSDIIPRCYTVQNSSPVGDVHGFLITLLKLAFLQHYHQSLEDNVFKASSDCFSQQLIITYRKNLSHLGLKILHALEIF